jgi:hypothetical protein
VRGRPCGLTAELRLATCRVVPRSALKNALSVWHVVWPQLYVDWMVTAWLRHRVLYMYT